MEARMLPAGPLMAEHRLIERMVSLLIDELLSVSETSEADTSLIEQAVDFFRVYADNCHHGKEEYILFGQLSTKELSAKHRRTMEELIEEHVYARKVVGRLNNANNSYKEGRKEALNEVRGCLEELVVFYPNHIEKEDEDFFLPCMEYFTPEEQEKMLGEFFEFDRKLIHDKYRKMVEALEKS